MFKKPTLILLAILLLATLIRLFFIFSLPDRVDEKIMADLISTVSLNNIPVHHDVLDGENVVMTYLALPWVRIFNFPTVLTFRFISLIASLFFIVTAFLLVRKLFSQSLALLVAGLLAIWPWSVIVGAIGYNVYLLPFFYTLATYFLFCAFKTKSLYYLSMVFFALSFYAYSLSFFWVPLFLLIFFVIYKKEISGQAFGLAILFLLVLILPISLFFLKNQFHLVGLDKFLFFTIPDLTTTRFSSVSILSAYSGIWIPLNYLFNYLLHFVLLFLAYNPFTHFWGYYFTYCWDVIFILIGLYYCWCNFRQDKKCQLLIVWFLTYPLASSFIDATAGFSFTRDIAALPLLAILSGIGILVFFHEIKKIRLSLRTGFPLSRE